MDYPKRDSVWNKDYGFLSERKRQILDGICPDATNEEVLILYKEMKRRKLPHLAERLDRMYPDAVFAEAKAIVREAGLNPRDFKYSRRQSRLFINGLSLAQWRMAYDPGYHPDSYSTVCEVITKLRKEKKDEIADLIEERHHTFLDASNRASLTSRGINQDDYDRVLYIRKGKIENTSVQCWKAFNDPNFVPSVTHLKRWLEKLEKEGDYDKAGFLRDKYESLLYRDEPEPDVSLDEAKYYFRDLLGPDIFKK